MAIVNAHWRKITLWIALSVSLQMQIYIEGLSTTTPYITRNDGTEVTLICNRDDELEGTVVWQFHAMLHPTRYLADIAAVSHYGLCMPDRTTAWYDDISCTGNSHLVIHRLRVDRDEGYFRCSLGVERITIMVTVLVPVQTVALHPAGTVTLRTTQVNAATFTCTATSKPEAAVTWERVNPTGAVILSGATARETIIEDLTQVFSSLSYTPQKEHNGDRIRCSAMNTAMIRPVVSSDANLIIYYPPYSVRAISGYTNPATESSTESLHLSGSVNGVANPNTLIYTWSSDCGTGVRNGSQISVPRNRTMNNKQCYCTVTHSETGWNQNSPYVEFNITYIPDVTVSVRSTPVAEGGSTQLECHPSAVPDSYTYIDWTQYVNGVRVREFTGSKVLNLNNLIFENSGEYRCSVKNIVGTGTGSDSVNIKYASRLVEVSNFSGGMNDTATLSLKFIGDPLPSVTWYKDGSNSALAANVLKFSMTIVPIHVSWIFYKTPVTIPGYEATLTIHSVQEQDYTAYHATLDNGLRTYSLIPLYSAHLIPNEKPLRPSYFEAICDVTTAVVFWVSQFNGGLTQTFHLSYLNNGQRVSLSENDPGKGNPGIIKLETLEAGKNYTFAIFAKNSLGARGTVHTSCQTKESVDKPQRPCDFEAICDATTAVVSWVSQFDGGLTQTFHLSYLNNGQRVSLSEKDPGKGIPGIVKLETLEAGRNYTFAFFAKNDLGSHGRVHTTCQTKEIVVSLPPASTEADSSALVAAVAVAVPSVCIIIVLIIVICIVLRRLKLQTKKLNMAVMNAITLSAVASTPPGHMEDDKDAPNDEMHNTYDAILNEDDVTLHNDINQYETTALKNYVGLQTASLDKDGGNLHVVPALAHPTSLEQDPGASSNTEPREYETTSFGDGAVQYKNTRSEAEERCYEELKPAISTEPSNLNDSPYENKMVDPRIVYEDV